uniref:Uncharacterized protein n=1 Tax=Anguilla anguilla TaxID=7936 RepID=A0A0E9UK29_ANGAN
MMLVPSGERIAGSGGSSLQKPFMENGSDL